jgi:hypothetical protein
MTDNIRRSIYITPEMSEQVCKYAAAKNITFNQAIRILLENSLDTEAAKANQSVIRRYIHEEIENSIAPYMSRIEGKMEKRLIPMCAKSSRASAVSYATVIGMLTENYTDGRTHEAILSTAIKYAAKYLKEKPKSDDEALDDAIISLNRAYDLGGANDDF